LHILDERHDGDRVAITVQNAESALTLLGREGMEHRVVDLNLDEIFEAFVAGRRADAASAAQSQLQPVN
jgi:hypothetical protein